jgi:glycosyltransferase involved in cell wall biosynthesis
LKQDSAEQKMNILFIFGQELTIGGHFKSGQALIRGLCARGHHVSVIVTHGEDRLIKEFKEVGSSVFVLPPSFFPNRPWGRVRLMELALRIFTALPVVIRKKQIDIIHSQDNVCARVVYWVAILLRTHLVFTHAGGESRDLGYPAEAALAVYSRELQDFYTANARFAGGGGIYYLPQRIDTTVYYPENSARFAELVSSEKPAVKIFMAIRIHPCKQAWLETLFSIAQNPKAFALPRRVEFTIAGSGPLLEEMRLRAAQIRHPDLAIRFIGPVTKPGEIRALINQSHFVAGNARGIMEAMACGCPVIVLGEQGEAELVTAENMERIAYYNFSGRHLRGAEGCSFGTVLAQILRQPDQAVTCAEFLRNYTRENLSHEAGAGKLETIYKNSCVPAFFGRPYWRWEAERRTLRKGPKNGEGYGISKKDIQ